MRQSRAIGITGALLIAATPLLGGCPDRDEQQAADPPVKLTLWHTYNPQETATLNRVIKRVAAEHTAWSIQPSVIPFARAQNKFRRAIEECRTGAPDVFRAELPWIAEFVSKELVLPVPPGELRPADYLPQAWEAARYRGESWALPASIDCLALLYNRKLVSDPPDTMSELLAVARRATLDAKGHDAEHPRHDTARVTQWGFFVRADGYWFLPFLWAHGGRLLDPRRREVYVNQRRAVAALAYYRDLIHEHHVAPPRPSPSNDYEEQMRMFGAGEVAMIVNGPWATSDLLGRPAFEKPERLGVAPFPRGDSVRNPAPLSGHGFVVSRCAKDPAAAWRLARALSDRAAQIAFAQANSLIPTLRKAYEDPRVEASSFVVSFREALARARPRPRHPAVARIFDDFTPAVQAVLLGDATPQEALDGVARAWRRLVGPAKQPTTAPAAGGR